MTDPLPEDPTQTDPPEPDFSQTPLGMTDADLRHAVLAAIRLLAVLAAIAFLLVCWRVNWQSGVLLLIGAAISAASLWEWLRIIAAVNRRMDASHANTAPGKPPRIAGVLSGFILRLGLTLVVLYASLKHLHGSAFALAGGIGLGLVSLSFEAIRLMRRGAS